MDIQSAPVFYPTVDEFADPMRYIEKYEPKCVVNDCTSSICCVVLWESYM
jgi:hypothetical protein